MASKEGALRLEREAVGEGEAVAELDDLPLDGVADGDALVLALLPREPLLFFRFIC